MKKALALALCLVLAGMLAVDGTFAAEFTQAVREAANTLFKTVEGIVNPAPTTDPNNFKVALVYPGSSPGLALLTPGNTTVKNVAVQNQSKDKSAYFRIAFAVQADVHDHLTLHFNEGASSPYTWSCWREGLTIGEKKFDLRIGTYREKLAAGKPSAPALYSVALDNITSQQMDAFAEDFLQIQVLAICADDFEDSDYDSPEAALNQALPINDLQFNPFK